MRNNSDSNMGLDNDLIMSIESKNSKMKSQLKSQVKNKRKTTISIESEIDLKFRIRKLYKKMKDILIYME